MCSNLLPSTVNLPAPTSTDLNEHECLRERRGRLKGRIYCTVPTSISLGAHSVTLRTQMLSPATKPLHPLALGLFTLLELSLSAFPKSLFLTLSWDSPPLWTASSSQEGLAVCTRVCAHVCAHVCPCCFSLHDSLLPCDPQRCHLQRCFLKRAFLISQTAGLLQKGAAKEQEGCS